jgi:hypothetical protein
MTRRGWVGLTTIAVLLNFGGPPAGADNISISPALLAADQGGMQPETSQEQQQKKQKMDQQNLQEKQRLQAPDRSGEDPAYKENPPIGGQKEAGPADFPQPAFPWVKGQLMQIEGEFYVLKDAEGKDVRVHVDKGTKMGGKFSVGDILEAKRTLQGHALEIKKASGPLATSPSSASSGAGPGSGERIIKDEQVSLSGAKQAVRGEVLKSDGNNYVIKDGHGNEVRLMVNQNTRMFCGPEKTGSSLLPAPSASDKPELKGQPQDLAKTAEQQGSEVGPGTKPGTDKDKSAAASECAFKKGDMIEAEISDMGAATFIKQAGRAQPGQPLP